jgi:hypothetical protein
MGDNRIGMVRIICVVIPGRDYRPKAKDDSPQSITTGGGYGFRARLCFAEPAIGPAKGRRNDNSEVGEHMIGFSESLR